jgi:hypothetical protein
VPARNHAARGKLNRRPSGVLQARTVRVSSRVDAARNDGRLMSDAELFQFDYALLTLERYIDPKNFGFWGRGNTELRQVTPEEIRDKSIGIAGYPGTSACLHLFTAAPRVKC